MLEEILSKKVGVYQQAGSGKRPKRWVDDDKVHEIVVVAKDADESEIITAFKNILTACVLDTKYPA